MIDWLIAFGAIALLAAFLGVIGIFVPEPDLLIVLAAIVVFAAIDFLRDLTKNKHNGK